MTPDPTTSSFAILQPHARRVGPPPDARDYGTPFEPTDPVAHEACYVASGSAHAGALWVDRQLHLAAGPEGHGWRWADGAWQPLRWDALQPAVLDADEAALLPASRDRRAPLATLRWCTLVPEPGERVLLVSGFPADASRLPDAEGEALLATLPEPARPGFFGRLAAVRSPEGVALTLTFRPPESPPSGWLPWLRHHQARGLEYACWGTEGGGEMTFHDEPAPVGSLVEGMKEVLRKHPIIEHEQLADLYEIWREAGTPADDRLDELVAGAPERGFVGGVELNELAEVLTAHAGGRDWTTGLRWERFLPGQALVSRLREAVQEPVALALHAEPTRESVVIWFLCGGVSRASGRMELFLTERVWS